MATAVFSVGVLSPIYHRNALSDCILSPVVLGLGTSFVFCFSPFPVVFGGRQCLWKPTVGAHLLAELERPKALLVSGCLIPPLSTTKC